jgi:transmembrane sensor
MNKEQLQYLIRRQTSGQLTLAEKRELIDWLADEEHRAEFVEWTLPGALDGVELVVYDDARWGPVLRNVLEQDRNTEGGMFPSEQDDRLRRAEENDRLHATDEGTGSGKRRLVVRSGWWMAAAAVLVVVSVGVYLLSMQTGTATVVRPIAVSRDVEAPAKARAVITLADGRQLSLDSVANGKMGRQGIVDIVKEANGQVTYSGKAETTGQQTTVGQQRIAMAHAEYNTLTVPRGSRVVQLRLGDGTKVWINCGSSLRYPVMFSGSERVVEVSGEAYFEVASNAQQPFVVRHDSLNVRVLGTHFNVNAYDDERLMSVTLLEGAVRVAKGRSNLLLHRGQQAVEEVMMRRGQPQTREETLRLAIEVDTSAVMAWKNGLFQFGDATDMAVVMRQLARWYDVDVEYRGGGNGHIGGTISRSANISKVLEMLQMTGAVHFNVEGRKVTVLP